MAFEPPVCAHNYRQILYNYDDNNNQFVVYCTKCLDVKIVSIPLPPAAEQPEGPEPPVLTNNEQTDLKSYEDNVEKTNAESEQSEHAV